VTKTLIGFNGSSGSLGSMMPNSLNTVSFFSRANDTELEIQKEFEEKKPDIFIHMAALTDVNICEKNYLLANAVNSHFPLTVYKAASKNNVKRFIYISTSHVYKPTSNYQLIKTIDLPNPQNIYGKTKLTGERMLLEFSKGDINTELIIVRLFSLLSQKGRDNFLLQSILRRADSRDFSYMPGLNNVRDFLWAEDACNKIIEIADSVSPPQIINLCSGSGRTIQSLVEEIFQKRHIDPSELIKNSQNKDEPNYLVGEPTCY